jgi:hypothetical protein
MKILICDRNVLLMQQYLSQTHFDVAFAPVDLLTFYGTISSSYKNSAIQVLQVSSEDRISEVLHSRGKVELYVTFEIQSRSLNELRILKSYMLKVDKLFVPHDEILWKRISKKEFLRNFLMQLIQYRVARIKYHLKSQLRKPLHKVKYKIILLLSLK